MPFKWRSRYVCFYCGKNNSEYVEFKKHTKSHGPCSTKDNALKIIRGSHVEIKLDISDITCEICDEPFTNLDEILDHLICKHDMEYDKTVDIPFQEYRLVDSRCHFCGEHFTSFWYLVKHINFVHPKHTFVCVECGVTFTKKRDLADHLRQNHREGGYPCNECKETFDSYSSLRKHRNHCRKCKTCNSNFASQSLLQKHRQLEHPDDVSLTCSHCSKQCNSTQGLKQHMDSCTVKVVVKVAPKVPTPNPTLENSIEPNLNFVQMRQNILTVLNMSTAIPFKFLSKFYCFYCFKGFVEFEELKEHTTEEHPICDLKLKCMKKLKGKRINVRIDISNLACKICCQAMDDLDALIDHIIGQHKANYDKSVKRCIEPFKIEKDNMACPLCPNVFRYFGILLRHINSEHSSKNTTIICDFCGRCFKDVTNLNIHLTHAHTGACKCDICGTKFKNPSCLDRHKARCHDVKEYKCPKCPELFQSHYQKQKHLIEVHDTGHKCSYCGRMFTRNSFMKDHIRRTHLKEKNVPCSVCNERFFDNYHLKLHMVKHKRERNFSCEVCGKAFLRRSNLNTHKQMHNKK